MANRERRMVTLIHAKGQPVRFNKRPTRNMICPCGSGLKFKHCHVDTWDEWLKNYWDEQKSKSND